MTRRQAHYVSVAKRILGWLIFIPVLISTLISMMKYIANYPYGETEVARLIMDFAKALIDMLQDHTRFFQFFWNYSPLPDFHHQSNFLFWIIYALIFIAMALQASGARMSRQLRLLRENLEAQLIIERAKGEQGLDCAQLDAKIEIANHCLLRQVFVLYILPVLIIVAGYFVLSFSSLL